MAPKSLAKKSLEQKVQYLLDYQAVERLMQIYSYKLDHFQFDDIVELFAKKTPGGTIEIADWGVYDGFEGVKKCFYGYHDWACGKPPKPGLWSSLMDVNKVIEVAGDGKTAKAVSECWGFETYPVKDVYTAWHCFAKRGFDFVKEDEEWKIWHYHVYNGMMYPSGTDWVKFKKEAALIGQEDLGKSPDNCQPDRPSTVPLWEWSPTTVLTELPKMPVPHETWDEETSFANH